MALQLGNSGSAVNVALTSTAAGPVQVAGKCLDAPSGAERTRIQINDCNGATAQHVTVTSTGELQMRDMCLDIANGNASNGAAVILAPCAGTSSQIWQFR